MSGVWFLVLVMGLSYLLGAIPFGYLIAKAHGINIMERGSGNIGATNVARVVGKAWGLLVFALDFSKGALPVFLAGRLTLPDDLHLWPQSLPVLCGVAAFLGHLFPIYLGFRGGKGVATGAGVIAILLPGITVLALLAWGLILWFTRYVALASIVAAFLLFALQLILTADPWGRDHIVVTLFCLVGSLLVCLRHHSNIRRLLTGTEPRI